jgi:leucyl-tRNA synthetase
VTGTDQSAEMHQAFVDYGVLINSGEWGGKLSEVAIKEMAAHAEKKGFGGGAVTYRLRDWGISRQRFWGAPVPIINCEKCGAVPVPYEDLPVLLPENAEFTGSGESPLAGVAEFVNTTCPKCHVQRGEKLTRWTRLSIRPGTSSVIAIHGTMRILSILRLRNNGYRWISTSGATHTRYCT